MVIIADGLDLDTLYSLKDSSPFLNNLASPEFTCIIHNKTSSGFSMEEPKPPASTLLTHTSISDYVHNESILIENNYIFDEEFKETQQKDLPEIQKIVGIDCEMVKCEENLKLARVTIIGSNFEVLLDELVKVEVPITDYLTKFSGMTEEILEQAQSSLEDVREKVLELIGKDTIVCGHSVENDFFQLKIRHLRVIDTAIIYPHPVPGYKHKLKYLVTKYLSRNIQAVIEK